MRASERMTLLEKIGTELQRRYTFADIDGFFAALDIKTQDYEYGGSKRVYAKEVLKYAHENIVLRVASDLNLLGGAAGDISQVIPPKNWQNTKDFRLFISHISKDKLKATRLKQALAKFDIAGFVAHEDIHPTLPWQDEIERGLQAMDALIAVHTPGFKDSIWTQQEVGYALGRGVKLISLKIGEDPTGFIGKHQALARRSRTAEQIAEEVDKLLSDDPRTADKLQEAKDASWEVPF